SSRRRHTRFSRDWSSDVCSSDLLEKFLGGMLPDLERLNIKDWHFCGSREIHGANWKVAYDGYLEGYHFAAAHPETIHQRTYSNRSEERRVGKDVRSGGWRA